MNRKVVCLVCTKKGIRKEMYLCCVCKKGPIHLNCLANDIEHEAEDYPFCEDCLELAHWCSDCGGVISLPTATEEEAREEVFHCAGVGEKKCGVVLCDYCSIGGDDYSSEDYCNEDVIPSRRRCNDCREVMRKNRSISMDV